MYREHQADATLQMVGEAPKTIVTEPLEATTETAADSAETPKGGHSDIQALLVAEDLTKYYTVNRGLFRGKGSVKALNGISFTLEKGRTLAVVGESGCGKSTLAKVLTMIETPTGGALLYKGESLLARSAEVESIRRQKIQIIFQNPYGSLNPRKKIGKILEEPLLINTDLSADERKSRVLTMMEKDVLRGAAAKDCYCARINAQSRYCDCR